MIDRLDRRAYRILQLAQGASKKGISAPAITSLEEAKAWLQKNLTSVPRRLDPFRSELNVPFARVDNHQGQLDVYMLNQHLLGSAKQAVIYCLSFTSVANQGYTQMFPAAIAHAYGVPVLCYDAPQYKESKVFSSTLNKLDVTAELLAQFCDQYLSGTKDITMVGNSQGSLVATLTAATIGQLPNEQTVKHIMALDPPTLQPGTAWELFWRGIKDARDYHERMHFPTPTPESWELVWDVYGDALAQLRTLARYAQNVFGNNRLSYLRDIASHNILDAIQNARQHSSDLKVDIFYGSNSRITGKHITDGDRVRNYYDANKDSDVQFHGVPGATHAMLVNVEEFLQAMYMLEDRSGLSEARQQ
jgi:pimeloyl-ACP methyl ester carboxylesterase